MKSICLLLVGFVGSVSFAQSGYPEVTPEQINSMNCVGKINGSLNDGFGGYGYGDSYGAPFVVGGDGKTAITSQDRIVSRETKGNVETIVYKKNVMVGMDQNMKPIYEVQRETVTLRRDNGQVISISKAGDLKKQAAQREQFKKSEFGKQYGQDYKLIKSSDTTFKHGGSGCETEQKMIYAVADEKGKDQDITVTYDKGFCDRIKPTISKIGANNAAECGPLISAAERAFETRATELKKEGKTLVNSGLYGFYGNTGKTQRAGDGALSMSMAIASCIGEGNPYAMNAGYYGKPSGSYGGIMGYTGGMMGTPSSGTTKTETKSGTR